MVVVTGKDSGRDSGLSPYVPAVEGGRSASVSTDALVREILDDSDPLAVALEVSCEEIVALARALEQIDQLREGYYVDAQQQRERAEAVERERDGYLKRLDEQVVWRQREEVRAETAEEIVSWAAKVCEASDPEDESWAITGLRAALALAATGTKERA